MHASQTDSITSVIFDLGGVVVHWDSGKILEHYYADPDIRTVINQSLFQHPDWLELDRGTLLEAEAIERLQQRCHRPREELAGLFEAVRRSLRPNPATVELLEALARRKVPLYCLSNMPARTFAYLQERHHFFGVFQGIVISGEVKMVKPDRAIFDYLLDRYRLKASQTAFVDDHPANIEAATALGLRAVWFRDAEQCRADLNTLLGSV